MRRIQKFSDFSAIYEADVPQTDQSKLYDTTLGQIITSILNNYTSEVLYPVKDYSPSVPADIKYVSLAPAERKIERFKEIIERVNKAGEDNKDIKAQEVLKAWVEAANKSVEALEALIEQYQGDPQELEYISKVINSRLEEYLKELEDQANESRVYSEDESLNEGIFDGKDGMMNDIETQISIVNSKLANLSKTPGMATSISNLQNEVLRISQRLGELRQMKKKEVKKEELKNIASRLSQIPSEVEGITQKVAKQDITNKNAASILIQALDLASKADKLEQEYIKTKEVKAEEEKKSQIKVKAEGNVEFDSDKIGQANDTVKQVQQLIIDKFGSVKSIADLPQYKDFARFGADGKFGSKTKEIIKVIQKGLGYEELTGNITPSFVEKIQTEKIVESESFRTIYKFSEFKNLFEDFDVKAAVEYAKGLPSFNTSLPSSGSGSQGRSGVKVASKSEVKEAEGSSFGKKSAEEKWNWLTKTYVVGAKPGSYKVASASPDTYNGKKIIRFGWEGYKNSDFPITTVCWYPEGDSLGEYKDYIYPDGKAVLIEEGKWGNKIDSQGKSSSGNFFTVKEYPFDKKKADAAKKVSSDAVIKEIARDIVKATQGGGTDPTLLMNAVKKIQSKGDLDAVNAVIKASYDNYKNTPGQDKYTKGREILGIGAKDTFKASDYSDLKSAINGELEYDNGEELISIVNHLKGKGINASYTPSIDKYSKKPLAGSWTENTFNY